MNYKEILISSITFLGLDFVYLYNTKDIFDKQIFNIQNSEIKINYIGMILCYLLLIFGINYFVISDKKSLSYACLLGLFVYGVYEFTNLAILDKWTYKSVIIDTLWGGILFTLTAFITYKLVNNPIDLSNTHPASIII